MKVTLHYRKGYKGQVDKTLEIQTPLRPAKDIETEYLLLVTTGLLTISKGYAYDFASGPTIDYPEWIRAAALPHDALCQLFREGYLDADDRRTTDKWFRRILKANGMNPIRREVWYRGVRLEAGTEAGPKETHMIDLEIPE